MASIFLSRVWPVQGHDASAVTALVAPEEATPSTKISTQTAPKPAAGHQIPWRHGARRVRFATGGRILPGWAREFDSGRRTPRPAGPEEGAGGWAPSRGGPAARRAPAGPLRVMNHHAQRVPACRRLSCRQATGQLARPGLGARPARRHHGARTDDGLRPRVAEPAVSWSTGRREIRLRAPAATGRACSWTFINRRSERWHGTLVRLPGKR
jgi:hypothetical protein